MLNVLNVATLAYVVYLPTVPKKPVSGWDNIPYSLPENLFRLDRNFPGAHESVDAVPVQTGSTSVPVHKLFVDLVSEQFSPAVFHTLAHHAGRRDTNIVELALTVDKNERAFHFPLKRVEGLSDSPDGTPSSAFPAILLLMYHVHGLNDFFATEHIFWFLFAVKEPITPYSI